MPVYLCLQPDVPTSLAHHDAETAPLPLSRRRSGESCAPRLRLGVVSLRSVVLASVQGWGYQSPEHFSRSEWLGLPVTRTLQPIRIAGATSHPNTSANQKVRINIQCDRNEEWPPRFPHKLKPSNGAKDWLVLNKTVKIKNDRTAHCDATIGEWVVSH